MRISKKLIEELWPIKRQEGLHFYGMAALIFCILFNQTVLRILKDSILIAEVNAEITNFVKIYLITPAAALFVIIYARMSQSLSLDKIFLYLTIFFLAFFAFFAWVIYPNVENWHLNSQAISEFVANYPYTKWYVSLFQNWSFVVFYVLAEFWPNVFYTLMFWQLANQTTSTEQATRFYIRLILLGNFATMIGSIALQWFSSEQYILTVKQSYLVGQYHAQSPKVLLIQASVLLVIVFSFLSNLLFQVIAPRIKAKASPIRGKPSLKDSFRYIVSSKYLWLLLICSAAFGLSMNLIETIWKTKIKQMCPTVNEYTMFSATCQLWNGIVMNFMILVGALVLRYGSWFLAAMISPVLILVTGTIFFILVLAEGSIHSATAGLLVVSPLVLTTTVGAIQNILAKTTKYSIWDTTKEMLYIPLDQELQTKGKAAVDVASSKVGKSFSGLVQALALTIFPSATALDITPLLMLFFLATCIAWIVSTNSLYREYKKLV